MNIQSTKKLLISTTRTLIMKRYEILIDFFTWKMLEKYTQIDNISNETIKMSFLALNSTSIS